MDYNLINNMNHSSNKPPYIEMTKTEANGSVDPGLRQAPKSGEVNPHLLISRFQIAK
jgi:hypothetical protein